MNSNISKRLTCCLCITVVLCFFANGHAEIEWQIEDTIFLEGKPLDIVISKDGQTTYILSEKKILVYSAQEKKITDTIPLTRDFSQIEITPDGERLLLADKEINQISVIQVTPVFDIRVGQSPVIGNKDAKVHIFAFLDFQ